MSQTADKPLTSIQAPRRQRCSCGWWVDDDGRCVNRLCGEFGHAVTQDDNQEVGHDSHH
jgi:hypothetical protein